MAFHTYLKCDKFWINKLIYLVSSYNMDKTKQIY